jgi:preprotein translocase subunit SecA
VEENNFGIRKRLLEFDDVMNSQRTAIYSRRKNALFGDKLELDLDNILYDVSESTVYGFQETGDFDGFSFEIIRNFGIQCPFSEDEFISTEPEVLIEKLYLSAREGYNRKSKIIQDRVFPVIQNVFENQSDSFENIVIPFTDGRKGIKIVVNLKEAYESKGAKAINALERSITLGFIDNEWKEHLREMDFLKQSAQNAQYEQKDPLLIYKLEGYELFKVMLDKLNKDIISFLMKAQLPNENEQTTQSKAVQPPLKQDLSKLKTGREDLGQSTKQNAQMAQKNQGETEKRQPVSVLKRPGRNQRVKLLNLQSGETKEMKFKQAEPLINTGSWQLVD